MLHSISVKVFDIVYIYKDSLERIMMLTDVHSRCPAGRELYKTSYLISSLRLNVGHPG
jgi:hypothetical protein